jgi:hypothetical protein
MSDVLPKGEALRRAVRWIAGMRAEQPERRLGALLDEATLRFDLTPRQAEGLAAFLRSGRSEDPDHESAG